MNIAYWIGVAVGWLLIVDALLFHKTGVWIWFAYSTIMFVWTIIRTKR